MRLAATASVIGGSAIALAMRFEVGRLLPFAKRRMVGPFIFFDRMGPVDFRPAIPSSVDVRPHPHIGLATLTYLFDGEIMHRDSVGSEQPIRPGEVNWMVAGRGITHSERFGVLAREAYPEVPPRVEYRLTEFGEKFASLMDTVDSLQAELENRGSISSIER